jgi:hypothetical protein
MHDLVKSYLVHYGYIETLQAMEGAQEPPLIMNQEEAKEAPEE